MNGGWGLWDSEPHSRTIFQLAGLSFDLLGSGIVLELLISIYLISYYYGKASIKNNVRVDRENLDQTRQTNG